MNKSTLISLWYHQFCILRIKPRPDFTTFCQVMERMDYNFDRAMEYYKKKFVIDP
jgi:hypothetical protein